MIPEGFNGVPLATSNGRVDASKDSVRGSSFAFPMRRDQSGRYRSSLPSLVMIGEVTVPKTAQLTRTCNCVFSAKSRSAAAWIVSKSQRSRYRYLMLGVFVSLIRYATHFFSFFSFFSSRARAVTIRVAPDSPSCRAVSLPRHHLRQSFV
jgi:hypothetical protein